MDYTEVIMNTLPCMNKNVPDLIDSYVWKTRCGTPEAYCFEHQQNLSVDRTDTVPIPRFVRQRDYYIREGYFIVDVPFTVNSTNYHVDEGCYLLCKFEECEWCKNEREIQADKLKHEQASTRTLYRE